MQMRQFTKTKQKKNTHPHRKSGTPNESSESERTKYKLEKIQNVWLSAKEAA